MFKEVIELGDQLWSVANDLWTYVWKKTLEERRNIQQTIYLWFVSERTEEEENSSVPNRWHSSSVKTTVRQLFYQNVQFRIRTVGNKMIFFFTFHEKIVEM